ncbi:MAG TPA: preprotein translocase subunit YajC [Saprospiraceae bacterium]|nr:preprotein translocase subunit YajC [Saprospiraceae bacterium]HMP23327.1 preprotein translocase subunit YajC [Saprospiraceae bacterium]
MVSFDVLLLQAGGSAGTINFLFLGAMLLIFWLFLIRPQAKRQREQKSFQDGLTRGEEVVTSSGILGKITRIDDEILTLEIGNKAHIRVMRNAISKEMTESVYANMGKTKKANDNDKKSEDTDTTPGG